MQKTLLLIFFSLSSLLLEGQTFKLGLMSGINISKFGGGESYAYNYLGYKLGGKIGLDLQRQFRVSVDLQYNRKGNIPNQSGPSVYKTDNISLGYIDIPITFTFMDWMDDPDEEDYYRLHFSGGVSYGRLTSYKGRDDLGNDVTNNHDFNKVNWSLFGGLVYYLNEHIGLNLEYSHSVSNLEQVDSLPELKVRNWSMSILYMMHNKRRSR